MATAGVEQNNPRLMPDTAKPGALGPDGQITLGDELTARGGGDAVDLGDDRLGEAHELQHQVAAAPEQARHLARLA